MPKQKRRNTSPRHVQSNRTYTHPSYPPSICQYFPLPVILQPHHSSPPPTTSLPLIPLLLNPQLHQPPRAQHVPIPEQRRHVHVQGGIQPGVGQQHTHRTHHLEHAVRRRPPVLEQVEADLARLRVDVGVHDGRGELDDGRLQRVGGRDGDGQEPASVWLHG